MAGFGFDFEAAAVTLCEGIDNGEAEAGARVAFCREVSCRSIAMRERSSTYLPVHLYHLRDAYFFTPTPMVLGTGQLRPQKSVLKGQP